MTWPQAVDAQGWMRKTERRIGLLERVPRDGGGGGAAPTTIVVEDTTTLDLTLTGDPATGYTLSGTAKQTTIQVTDTATIDLTLSGSAAAGYTLGADLKGGWAWLSYTPTLTAPGGTNPSIGSTGSTTGAFVTIGRVCFWRCSIAPDGAGISAGNGGYQLSLPPGVPPRGGFPITGHGWVYGVAGFKPFIMDTSRMLRMDGVQISHADGMNVAGHVLTAGGTYEF